jgi:hypothetical protein
VGEYAGGFDGHDVARGISGERVVGYSGYPDLANVALDVKGIFFWYTQSHLREVLMAMSTPIPAGVR